MSFANFSFDDVASDFAKYAGDRSFGANLGRAGLTWSDSRSMQQVENKSRFPQWIPAWTASDKLLRKVIEAKIKRHIEHMTWRLPSQPLQLAIILQHQAAINRAGGYPQLVASIAYRSFRLGWTSPAIAESLGVTPTMVRQLLYRLRQTARRIGVERDEPRQPSAGVRLRGARLRALRARLSAEIPNSNCERQEEGIMPRKLSNPCGWCKKRESVEGGTRCRTCRAKNRAAYRASKKKGHR